MGRSLDQGLERAPELGVWFERGPDERGASSEPFGVAPFAIPAAESRPLPERSRTAATSLRHEREGARQSIPTWLLLGVGGGLSLLLVLAGGLALRLARHKLPDAEAADRAAAVLLERPAPTAEDARLNGSGEHDRLALDGDLDRILLSEPETLPDLDRNHDPAQLVDVADDSRLNHPPLVQNSCLRYRPARFPCRINVRQFSLR
jgi:hypothetical protein